MNSNSDDSYFDNDKDSNRVQNVCNRDKNHVRSVPVFGIRSFEDLSDIDLNCKGEEEDIECNWVSPRAPPPDGMNSNYHRTEIFPSKREWFDFEMENGVFVMQKQASFDIPDLVLLWQKPVEEYLLSPSNLHSL